MKSEGRISINGSMTIRHLLGVHDDVDIEQAFGDMYPETSPSWNYSDLPSDQSRSIFYNITHSPDIHNVSTAIGVHWYGELDVVRNEQGELKWSVDRLLSWFNYITTELTHVSSAHMDVLYFCDDYDAHFLFWIDPLTCEINIHCSDPNLIHTMNRK